MDATPRPIAAVILCGGASRRMGADKATIEVDGQPLLHRVAARLEQVADPLLVATGTVGRLGRLPWTEVGDPPEHLGQGPLAGMVAGLRASPHGLVAVVAADMPFPDARLLQWLAERCDGQGVVPVDAGGTPQPLHGVYVRSCAGALAAYLARGERRVLPGVLQAGVRLVPTPKGFDPRWSSNVNRPEDLDQISGFSSCLDGGDPS